MKNISQITYISDIRKVWPKEDHDFTPWLQENISALSQAIKCEIINPEIEEYTGDKTGFKVDIVAELISGEKVVIENQYGSSDHDHLGKLLTYRTSFGAKVAIWIVESARQEHVEVINWLNENDNGCSFFLLKISAIQVDSSAYAPLITLISGPIAELKALGKMKKEDGIRHIQRKKYWEQLLQAAKQNNIRLLSRLSSSKDSWIAAGAGKSGITYALWLNKNSMRVELRIDTKDPDVNLEIFNKLKSDKIDIDNKIQEGWDWISDDPNDALRSRRCSIQKTITDGGWESDEVKWGGIIDEALQTLVSLEDAVKKYLKAL